MEWSNQDNNVIWAITMELDSGAIKIVNKMPDITVAINLITIR